MDNIQKTSKQRIIDGAKKSAEIQKQKSLGLQKQYYKNPLKCLECGKVISYEKRCNRFCNHSCAASNQKNIVRNGNKIQLKYCLSCNKKFKPCHSLSLARYCCNKCRRDYEWEIYKTEIEKAVDGNPRNNEIVSYKIIKRYLKETRGHRCEICKRTEWQGQEIPLILDHIDGHSEDNNLTNLRLVCGNCDAQLPTYKSKNKGNGRANRRKRYAEGKSY